MTQPSACVLALVVAAYATTLSAQPTPVDGRDPSRVAPAPAQPLPPQPPVTNPLPERRDVTVGPCDAAGCWATNGTRYDRVGGNTLVGSDGRMCQYVGGGLPLACP
jgi:hypothetical protein